MDIVKLEFDVGTTDAESKLGVRVILNQDVIYNNPHVTKTDHVSYDIGDQDAEHVLTIELYGKLPEHTEINSAGQIVKDALVTVENMHVDGIDISSILTSDSNQPGSNVPNQIVQYYHDFNGSGHAIVDRFYGSMGCNGIARLKFTTPIYLWLLENM